MGTFKRTKSVYIFLCVMFICLIWWSNSYNSGEKTTRINDDSSIVYKYNITPDCSCEINKISLNTLGDKNSLTGLSTCSDVRSMNNGVQNVASMCYYVHEHTNLKEVLMYHEGIVENIRLIRQFFPGFVMRIYSDATLEGDLCRILCDNEDIHWCDIRKTPRHGDLSKMYFMTWRFLPLGDRTVDVMLSRDLDGIISEREVACIRDWFSSSNKAFSVMRDHHWHNIPVLGGTWGVFQSRLDVSTATEIQAQIISQSQEKRKHRKGFDQSILGDVLWPHKRLFVAYDSYSCKQKNLNGGGTEIRPFPVQRKNNSTDFVGNKDLGQKQYKLKPCPKACRPTFGQDWEYC